MKPTRRRQNGVIYYTTLSQAASILEEDLKYLKWCKNQGAPGFQSGRIYREEVLPYLDDNRLRYANPG